MAGTSSLLRSAASTQKKIAEQQDAQVAYDYSLSAKTYQDFQQYSEYLNSRRGVYSNDASKLLTLEKTVNAARKAYTTNEIQRANIDIIEGRSTSQDKYQKLTDLFYQAVDNNDYDQATSLNLQLDNLSVKMQNEAQVAADKALSDAKAFGAAGAKANATLLTNLEKGVNYITLPNGDVVKPLAMVSDEIQKTGGAALANGNQDNPLLAARETVDAIRQSVIHQYENATTQDEVDKLEQKYGAGLANLDKAVTFDFGGKKLNAQDLETAYQNDKINNPIYHLQAKFNEATGKNEFKLVDNNVDHIEYTRQTDPQTGQEYYTPTVVRTSQDKVNFGQSDQGRGLGTQLTNSGEIIGGGSNTGDINLGTGKAKRDEGQSIGNRLKTFGIEAKQNGTTLQIKLPGDVERTATIQPDGSVRYLDDQGQIVEIGLVDRTLYGDTTPPDQRTGEKAGQPRIVSADETSSFGTASNFGGQLSKAGAQGQGYLNNFRNADPLKQLAPVDLRQSRITGVGNATPGTINVGNNFSGAGAPVLSGLLQSANFTQGNVQKELQAKAQQLRLQAESEAANRLQQSQVFNLNQTPVQQFANNGVIKRQLSVTPLPAQPRVYVAPPAPTPKITSVGVANPGRITSVGVAR